MAYSELNKINNRPYINFNEQKILKIHLYFSKYCPRQKCWLYAEKIYKSLSYQI